jgi:4-hydroxy-tetrahydrodipicolinate reductase
MSPAVRVLLVGARGRMGRAIVDAAPSQTGVEIVAQRNRGDDIRSALSTCDVVVDFSHAEATDAVCGACTEAGTPLVIGTTGHSAEQASRIREAAASIPVVLASNFSVGVNALFWLTRKASELLGDGFDIEIVEMHHRLKKDAPSGTAKRLAEVACESRGSTTSATLLTGVQVWSVSVPRTKSASTRSAAAMLSAITPSSSPAQASVWS